MSEKKVRVIMGLDVGYHGFKVATYVKGLGKVDYFDMPADAVRKRENSVLDFTKLDTQSKMGLIYRGAEGATHKTSTYAVGEYATRYLADYSFRKENNVILSGNDRAFYELGEERFVSGICDVCILSSAVLALKRLVDNGFAQKMSDIGIDAVGFALPHDVVYDKNDIASDHVLDVLSKENTFEVSFDNGKSFTEVTISNIKNVSTVVVNEDNMFVESQAVCAMYHALLNLDGTAKDYFDEEGNAHNLITDINYFLPCVILDIGKRTAKALTLRSLDDMKEISEIDSRSYAMYNVDTLVAAEMNSYYELKEGMPIYFRAEDVDHLIANGQAMYDLDGDVFDINRARGKAIEKLGTEYYEKLKALEGGMFFRLNRFVALAGGGAELFFPVIEKKILNDYPNKNGKVILCKEQCSETESSSVYAVVGGMLRRMIFAEPELLK